MIYADTSWWVASKQESDDLHPAAIKVFVELTDPEIVWTPWQRVEVFNTIRQLERRDVIAQTNARQIIRNLETQIGLGYFPYVEFSWVNAVRRANELSIQHSASLPIRGMDLFHIAIALEIDAELLLTFDTDQATLAQAAGIQVHQWT